MEIVQDGVEVYCLPDNAYCDADEEKRIPFDIDDCPIGCEVCDGDCYYYREDDDKYKKRGAVMSGDLISRKDLLGTERLLMTDIVKDNPTARFILEQVLYDIENAKTVYDVDKVVEQLESAKTNFIGMGTIQSAYFDKGIDKAIEIVKSGGVDSVDFHADTRLADITG